ncbi:MAG: hypothetical protein MUP24_09150, partial [Gillisia sp.]|nr:hypothetical protein [Gillisia sp.]
RMLLDQNRQNISLGESCPEQGTQRRKSPKKKEKASQKWEAFFVLGWLELFQRFEVLEKLIVYEPGYWAESRESSISIPLL